MKKLKSILILAVGAMTLFSCSKDETKPENGKGKNIKLTFTVTGVNPAEVDAVSLIAVGLTDNTEDKTVWKINGAAQSNEQGISLGENDFTGTTKTYVIESIKPLTVANVSLQCINFDASYTISYKAEVNGKVETNDQNVVVATDKDYTHSYSY